MGQLKNLSSDGCHNLLRRAGNSIEDNRDRSLQRTGDALTDLQDSPETNDLLARATSGDDSALRLLWSQQVVALRRMVTLRLDTRLRPRFDESDVLQDTFCEVQRRLPDYLVRRPMSFGVWVRKTAEQTLLRLYRQHFRSAKRSVQREQLLTDHSSLLLAQAFCASGDAPGEIVLRQELQDRVEAAVQRMPSASREILIMRHLEELSYREIGQLLDIAETAARQRYGRALVRLRLELSNEEADDSGLEA